METLLALPVLGPFLGVVAPFLVVLGVVIFVHEYGHYIVGRWSGIHAEVFSIGFGREIVGWDDRRGTRWRLCWIPLGGYVKFKGDANAASGAEEGALEALSEQERRSTLQGAPLWARAATVAAGPVANFLLTIVIITALGLAIGKPSQAPVIGEATPGGQAYAGGLRSGDRVVSVDGRPISDYSAFVTAMFAAEGASKNVVVERMGGGDSTSAGRESLDFAFNRLTRVANVTPGGPAALACVKPGDVIQKVNGETVSSFVEIQQAVKGSNGEALTLTLQRGQDLVETSLTPALMETPDPTTGAVTQRLLIGVSADFNIGLEPHYEDMGLGEAFWSGLSAPWRIAKTTMGYLGAIFSGQSDGSSLRGPLGIAEMSGQAAAQGLVSLIVLMATLSTAIGLMNLFPVPILDGGHLVFFAIEGLTGRPVSARIMEAAMTAGFVALMGLLVFATSNDVPRFFGAVASGC